jgi:alkylated DNA repair dioxygenase AlkB
MPGKRISASAELPEGFRYQAGFLGEGEEGGLLRRIESLQFEPYDFRGYKARRRIVPYGGDYGYVPRQPTPEGQAIPEFLLAIRERAAAFAGVEAEEIVQALITEYSPGTPIGWHRDRPQFGTILGISLASACRMRLKPYKGEGKIASLMLEPRSIYAMQGTARWDFVHSIPAVEKLRYSITFRTLAKKEARRVA